MSADFTVTYEDIVGKDAMKILSKAIAAFPKDQLEEAERLFVGVLHAMVIEPSGTIRIVYPANGSEFELEELQSFVEGSIELVTIWRGRRKDNGRCEIYVNNDGIPEPQSGIEGLPLNVKATAFMLQYCTPDSPGGLHGNVLFLWQGPDE